MIVGIDPKIDYGMLDAASAETVCKHLDTCADCRQRGAGLPGDSFVGQLRRAGTIRRQDGFVPGETLAPASSSTDASGPWGDLRGRYVSVDLGRSGATFKITNCDFEARAQCPTLCLHGARRCDAVERAAERSRDRGQHCHHARVRPLAYLTTDLMKLLARRRSRF
jgi:hypothetical protein